MIFFIRVQISGNKDTEFFKILLENLPHMNSPNKKNGELQHNWSTVWVPAHKLKQKNQQEEKDESFHRMFGPQKRCYCSAYFHLIWVQIWQLIK